MVKILLVDDEKDFLFILKNILKRNGFEVQTMSTGNAVIEKVQRYKPKIVLLDISLDNGFDGRIICKEIKSDLLCPPSVFLCSGHMLESEVTAEFEGDEFLQKPIILPELLRKIKLHIN